MMDDQPLSSYPSLKELSEAACNLLIELANKAIEDRGVFRIALAGGSTPQGVYKAMCSKKYIDKTDWSRWVVYMGDERIVPLTDERSNYAMANASLLAHVPIKKSNIYAPPVDLVDSSVIAAKYEATIRNSFNDSSNMTPKLDLILLGLGSDGHTASLFPGKAALRVQDRLVVGSKPGVLPPYVDRVTLTIPFINAARGVLFLASGEDKVNAFQAAYKNTPLGSMRRVPASLVRPKNGELRWFVTKELALLG
jgi:6-phosphogluconolactonase